MDRKHSVRCPRIQYSSEGRIRTVGEPNRSKMYVALISGIYVGLKPKAGAISGRFYIMQSPVFLISKFGEIRNNMLCSGDVTAWCVRRKDGSGINFNSVSRFHLVRGERRGFWIRQERLRCGESSYIAYTRIFPPPIVPPMSIILPVSSVFSGGVPLPVCYPYPISMPTGGPYPQDADVRLA